MKKNKLLIVDDDEGMRRTLFRIMKAKGLNVEVAEDGRQAIRIAGSFMPDVVMLDIRMPEIDGVETWKQLKQTCPEAVAIFMTAYSTSDRTNDAWDAGCVQVFSKPLDIDAVCMLVQSISQSVLIIDDDAGFRESLKRALSGSSYHVNTVSCEADACRLLNLLPHSVVLLDMKLDGVCGTEVLDRLLERYPGVIVILMTGHSEMVSGMSAGLDLGAVSSLTKPFPVEELIKEIRRCTGVSDVV